MPFSAAQGRGLSVFGKNHPRYASVFFPKTLRTGALRCLARESETTGCFTLKRNAMKTTTASNRKKWIWRILLILLTALIFSYLYTRGVSPVWAAVAIVFCRGFFRFLYAIACLLVTLAIIAAILSFLIF